MRFKKTNPHIFGAGLIALDIVVGADRLPTQSWAGGTCCNVLTILSSLGWSAYPIARLNDDFASGKIKRDLKAWNVNLDFISCCKPTPTPIIIQKNIVNTAGEPTHKFFLTCPKCGNWLPSFRPITLDAVSKVSPFIASNAVFFMDRLSSASLRLAKITSERGGIIFFEPSSLSNNKYFEEALKISHIIKYASQRIQRSAPGLCKNDGATILEICTDGENGLEWRYKNDNNWGDWHYLKAHKAVNIIDTCGSGDWCTAGIIAKICKNGATDLKKLTEFDINNAFNFSQKLAAWNCSFIGARGGMYTNKKIDFMRLMETKPKRMPVHSTSVLLSEHTAGVKCPMCNSLL